MAVVSCHRTGHGLRGGQSRSRSDDRALQDHVALTFDDGPDPLSTPAFLAALDELVVRATLLVVGEQALRHRWLSHDIVRRGHRAWLDAQSPVAACAGQGGWTVGASR
ncbi:polysaccharide deacetylase family protein [Streptomyces sp. NPDC002134]|uniref:polysaccharide deacetylase family protein n=1 Tax=Streptomyces sp. NPDC002134 TaxID=3364632 RepID=UPI0036BECE6D